MKTVIQFIHELGDGGGSSIVRDYSLCLQKDGYHVVVMVMFPELSSINYQAIKKAGIDICSVFNNRGTSNRIKNKFFAKYFASRKLSALINKYHPIAIHAHLQVLTYIAPCTNALRGVNVLYTCHSVPKRYFTGRYSSEYSAAKVLITKNNLQMIALHQDMANELNSLFGICNTLVVSNGINLQRFMNVQTNVIGLRKTLGIPKDAFVVGHIGRFSKVKNHRYLIDIFHEVVKRQPNAHLLLIGTGELREEIEVQLSRYNLTDKTTILTHRTDIPDLMKLMDVFVFPSLYEGLGIVVVEAQAVGLRCVVSTAIPKDAICSNYVEQISLGTPVSKWCDAILNKTERPFKGDLSSFDIERNVKKVETVYEKQIH